MRGCNLAVTGLALLAFVKPVLGQIWIQEAVVTASDGTVREGFGVGVSLDGDRLLTGAPLQNNENGDFAGAAYIFERNGTGDWIEVAKLITSDGANGDQFGGAVSLDGDRAMISAVGAEAVYVFERDSRGEWTEVSKLTASDGSDGDQFGGSVTLDGTRALIGASRNNHGDGSAYVFEREMSGGWTEVDQLSPTATDTRFGFDVSLHGDRALIGAFEDDDSGENAGAAYIYERNSAGDWLAAQKLLASDGATLDFFGFSVALDGDRALVGSHTHDITGQNEGAAYMYERGDSGVWQEVTKLMASDARDFDSFGQCVSLDGDQALVGASGIDGDAHQNHGGGYVFERNSSGQWIETAKLIADDPAHSDLLGDSVALDNGRALLGAPNRNTFTGAVFIFTPAGSCPLQTALEQLPFPLVTSSDQSSPAATLVLVRQFRDRVLRSTPAGRELVRLYYLHGREMTRIMAEDPQLARAAIRVVVCARPTFRAALVEGQEIRLSPDLTRSSMELIDRFSAVANPRFRAALRRVRSTIVAHSNGPPTSVVSALER